MRRQRRVRVRWVVRAPSVGPGEDMREAPGGDERFCGGGGWWKGESCWWEECWHFRLDDWGVWWWEVVLI